MRYALLVLAACACVAMLAGRAKAQAIPTMYPLASIPNGGTVYTLCNGGTRIYVTYWYGESAALTAVQDGCK